MLRTCEPKMLKTQPVPFEVHNLVGKQKCAESQSDVSDHHPTRGNGRSWSWEMFVQLSKVLGMQAEQELEDGKLVSVRAAVWSCPGEHTADGCPSGVPLGVGWGIQCKAPTPTRGPQAICSLGPCEHPRPLLGTRVQLSHGPCRVVVIATAATGPACRKKHDCRRMLPHRHSIVFTRARENGGEEMWEEVRVYEITETKWKSGSGRAETGSLLEPLAFRHSH